MKALDTARSLLASIQRRIGWFAWGIGVGVYVLAVFHRTSLGVAGPLAEARFSLNASQLSSFIMVQLGIYAMMQIPTGVLVDRFGPRRMLIAATTTMGAAQALFAVVENYPLALLARAILGCGDAMTYISVLRLVASWFPARRYAVLTAVTGLFGSLGNIVATVPLTALLGRIGWTPTFLIAGGLSIAYCTLLLRPAVRRTANTPAAQPAPESPELAAPVIDAPAPSPAVVETAAGGGEAVPGASAPAVDEQAGRRVITEVREAWRMPAGRLGFWVHLTTMSGPVVFSVLWGFPYLTGVLGFADSLASSLLLIFVVVGSIASLVIGVAVTRRPEVRTPLALVVAVGGLLSWVTLIAWPGGRPPMAVVVVVLCVLAVGGPASTVAFLLARDYNPRHRISTATGLVNVGGFAGTVVGIFLVGQILDWVDHGSTVHSVAAFRWAFAAIALLTAVGISRMLTWWLRTRAAVLIAAAWGEDVPVRVRQHRWELVDAALLAAVAEQSSRASTSTDADEAEDSDDDRT